MKTIIKFILLPLFLFLNNQETSPQTFEVRTSSGEDLALYENPQSEEAVALIPNGEILNSNEEILQNGNTWYRVYYGEFSGYVNGKDLTKITGMSKNPISATPLYQKENITKVVLVHATTNYEGYCYLLSMHNQNLSIQHRFRCKFGSSGINKQYLGDNKTPLGHYYVTSESSVSGKDYNVFGGYNIHLNYPNSYDRNDGKTGGGICIHGGYNRNTAGCVRILDDNANICIQNIQTVGEFVTKGTHVIISDVVPAALSFQTSGILPKSCHQILQTVCLNAPYSHSAWKNKANGNGEHNGAPANHFIEGRIKDADGHTNLREKPTTESRVLTKIPANERIRYLPLSNGWSKVTFKGFNGYVHLSRIR